MRIRLAVCLAFLATGLAAAPAPAQQTSAALPRLDLMPAFASGACSKLIISPRPRKEVVCKAKGHEGADKTFDAETYSCTDKSLEAEIAQCLDRAAVRPLAGGAPSFCVKFTLDSDMVAKASPQPNGVPPGMHSVEVADEACPSG